MSSVQPAQIERARNTPLHEAVRVGSLESVNALLDQPNMNIEAQNIAGATALHVAVIRGDTAIVTRLLQAGANPGAQNRRNQTPVELAAERAHFGCMSVFLRYAPEVFTTKANLLDTRNEDGETLFHFASRMDDPDLIRKLKAAGKDPNVIDIDRYTPLYYAAEEGHVDSVQALIAAGAKPSLPGQNLFSPLHAAATKTNIQVVSLLLGAGADVNALDDRNFTPLAEAAATGDSFPVTRLLIQKGANAGWRSLQGETVLHLAASQGNTDVIRALLNQKQGKDESKESE